MSRLAATFAALAQEKRAALITFVTAGDPDYPRSRTLLQALPGAGADIIELGMPFSDPVADGPAIQAASERALKGGMTLARTLDLLREFRAQDSTTPVVLMGYANPLYAMGFERFAAQAAQAGADGVIVVDLPPEEADELRRPLTAQGIDFIGLVAPTTTEARLPTVLGCAQGFVYYVSVAGTTGMASAAASAVDRAVARLKAATTLPVAVGFGIKTPEQAAAIAATRADAVVVGSALVERIAQGEDAPGFVTRLAQAVRGTRKA
ncbi:MAG: tryptophan synthase subunit alpha [Rhodospirillales bacterium]|nr:tryptophan synthase subunit alpha [Rhodospirillales bacterium]